MTARISRSARISMAHRAEAELHRYAKADTATGIRPHALWHRHVHNVRLDPMQVLKMQEMDDHDNTVDVSCRRTGKTACKEMYLLEHLATMPSQELGVVAPRMQQSQNNLTYHLDAIRRSELLRGYVAVKQGREQISDTKFQFHNGSRAAAYGIMSQIDGDSLTAASIEEVDDMPSDRLLSRFLPMLGAARRLGVERNDVSFTPQVRITGVFKGADTLQALIDAGSYKLLQPVDVYLGIELGILNEAFMLEMRAQLPEGEYIRQFLCRNVSTQNHIWEKHIRRAMAVGLAAGLEIAEPLPGMRYKRRGLIAFGYDHTGHGESPQASRSALVVTELIGNYLTFPFVRTWSPGTDDRIIARDLEGHWDYFRPDVAMGDAYGVGMLTTLCDRLYANGLTDIDRNTVGDGQSNASTWGEWPFAPIRFEGGVKHSMAMALRAVFHHGQAALPYFDDGAGVLRSQAPANVDWLPPKLSDLNPTDGDWPLFIRQLNNIKAVETKAAYSSYRMANPKLGDDLFDAACAAVWALTTRGVELVPTAIASRTQTRSQLLGERPAVLIDG